MPEKSRRLVSGPLALVAAKAEICSDEPDVLIDVDGQQLRVDLVLPDDGERCEVDQQHQVTLKLNREFDNYQISG